MLRCVEEVEQEGGSVISLMGDALIAKVSSTEKALRAEIAIKLALPGLVRVVIQKPIGENKEADYNTGGLSGTIMDEAAKACKPAADFYGLSVEGVRKALEDLAAKTARENTTRAKAKPRAKWDDRKGADAKLTPPEFIAKHYAAEMAAGTLHRGVIAQHENRLR